MRWKQKLKTSQALVASVSGRYYTMDRDKRWPRTELGYRVIAEHQGAEGRTAPSAVAALERSYADGVTDEFVLPVAIDTGDADGTVQPGDCLLFYNFRADRARQISTAFAFADFDGFTRDFIPDLDILTMTRYDDKLPAGIIFPEVELRNPLAEVLSQAGRTQLHAAETEKYPHVTYFFNGGNETPVPGEIAPPGAVAQGGDLRPAARDERLPARRSGAGAHPRARRRLHPRQLRQPGHGGAHRRAGCGHQGGGNG